MRILDRQRYWSFLKAYLICFVALVGLVVVIDAFNQLDEFSKVASGSQLMKNMGRFYLVRMSLFYDLLSGVIVMMAAVFTATWIQKNNELLAMLAAGIGTKRVIRPILIGAVLVNLLAVANQEVIMPSVADELLQYPDHHDDHKNHIFRSRVDLSGITISPGTKAVGDPKALSVTQFNAILPIELIGSLGSLDATEATYIPEKDSQAPLKGGWLLRGARISPPDLELNEDWLVKLDTPDALQGFPESANALVNLKGDTLFLKTNITYQALTRDQRRWFRYASTPELIYALQDPANAPERDEIAVFLHVRTIRPMLGMCLLFLALPMVLGSEGGRNGFVNLGLSLGTSAAFYGVLHITQYLGTNGVIPAELAGWGPLIAFGALAAARWDKIRT
ncbi:hypothetical protein BH23PLA1_BH23PLA1_27230 [soil metagenome]